MSVAQQLLETEKHPLRILKKMRKSLRKQRSSLGMRHSRKFLDEIIKKKQKTYFDSQQLHFGKLMEMMLARMRAKKLRTGTV